MTSWNSSAEYQKVAEANRQYYAKTAALYDQTETCVTDGETQAGLEAEIDQLLALLDRPCAQISALDACGGSGNISLKLLRRRIRTVTCDISPELLRILQQKSVAAGLQAMPICSEIASFLRLHPDRFDLIVFSSALHHLAEIDAVLELAVIALRPGGFLFTAFDPTPAGPRYQRLISWLDYLVFKVHRQPGDLLAAAGRRMRRTLAGSTHDGDKQALLINEANLGVIAEYHVERGIDDIALVERLRALGMEVVWHRRLAGGRYAPTRALLRALGAVSSFKLLLRKP
jgi:ubiquinone/menaquinone biosynthesis C-methylase UbiE